MGSTSEVVDLSKLLDGLDNKWVVLSRDNKKVLAVADELEKLGDKISKGVVMKVPDTRYSYAPSHFAR